MDSDCNVLMKSAPILSVSIQKTERQNIENGMKQIGQSPENGADGNNAVITGCLSHSEDHSAVSLSAEKMSVFSESRPPINDKRNVQSEKDEDGSKSTQDSTEINEDQNIITKRLRTEIQMLKKGNEVAKRAMCLRLRAVEMERDYWKEQCLQFVKDSV